MSDVDTWLAERSPPAPADLVTALRPLADGPSLDGSLMKAGISRLDEARAQPGRDRESAFRLLEADALLTYGCEAAVESDDPDVALRRILAVIGS